MVLKLYPTLLSEEPQPLIVEDTKVYAVYKISGIHTLYLEIEKGNKAYQYLTEESYIKYDGLTYVVKTIDERETWIVIKGEIDLDIWRRTVFYEYRRTSVTLTQVLAQIKPASWTTIGVEAFTAQRTVEGNVGEPMDPSTAMDILEVCKTVYKCLFLFDNTLRTITVINPDANVQPQEILIEGLNLVGYTFTGDSTNFATRMYAYGKKNESGVPLTFADINDGKEYVEDYTFSNKIVSVGWSDERYTIKANLKEEATRRLRELSYPKRSYKCNMTNLSDDVTIFSRLILVDSKRGTRILHKVVEHKSYPTRELDTVVLSSEVPRIQDLFKR